MGKIEDGGPAFPTNDTHTPENGWARAKDGMTLRDYFAAKAMQAVILHPQGHAGVWNMAAKDAYEIADAMLKARKGGAA